MRASLRSSSLRAWAVAGGDGQAHECKDCERMFPTKYRCSLPARPSLTPQGITDSWVSWLWEHRGSPEKGRGQPWASSLPRLRKPRP